MKDYPNWQERQKLLYARDGKASKEVLRTLGETAWQRQYFQDALEYFAGAEDAEGLAKIEAYALETGDSFLLQGLERLTHHNRPESLWEQVGQKAFELEKFRFARTAFEKTQNTSMLEKLASRVD